MKFSLNPGAGQPIYAQLIQQIRHAIEIGVLKRGEALPGIRSLAQQLVVSHNTVAKAYTELAREGIVELRHGSGVYVATNRRQARAEQARSAQGRLRELIQELREDGFSAEEILRLCEAELVFGRAHGAGRS